MSGSMPRPRSSISTAAPRPTTLAPTSIGHWGGENEEALSTSSASRWTRSSAAAPSTGMSGISPRMMRVDCSPAATAERMTSASGATSRPRSAASRPPMIIKFSALRRSRVDRCSTWTSRASCSAFRSARIGLVEHVLLTAQVVWLRWATVRNTAPAPARRRASSVAAATAHRCAAATAAPISPISPARSSADGSSAVSVDGLAAPDPVEQRGQRGCGVVRGGPQAAHATGQPAARPQGGERRHRDERNDAEHDADDRVPPVGGQGRGQRDGVAGGGEREVRRRGRDRVTGGGELGRRRSDPAVARRPSSDRSRLGRARAPNGVPRRAAARRHR